MFIHLAIQLIFQQLCLVTQMSSATEVNIFHRLGHKSIPTPADSQRQRTGTYHNPIAIMLLNGHLIAGCSWVWSRNWLYFCGMWSALICEKNKGDYEWQSTNGWTVRPRKTIGTKRFVEFAARHIDNVFNFSRWFIETKTLKHDLNNLLHFYPPPP